MIFHQFQISQNKFSSNSRKLQNAVLFFLEPRDWWHYRWFLPHDTFNTALPKKKTSAWGLFINFKSEMLLGFDTWWTAVMGARRWGGMHTSLLTPLTGRGPPPLLPVFLCFFSLFLLLFLWAWFRFSTTVLLWKHPTRQKMQPRLWEMMLFLSCCVWRAYVCSHSDQIT